MSDNVSQLHAPQKKGLVKKILIFVLLAVLIAGGVAAWVFRDELNLDALQRYVRYLNVSDDSKTGSAKRRRCMLWQMKNGRLSESACAFCSASASISSDRSAPMTR